MLELKFATYHRAAEVCPHRQQASLFDVSLALSGRLWTLHYQLMHTLAVLTEGSLTRYLFKHQANPSLDR